MLNEQQIHALRWIAAGCPAGVMEGYGHRVSAAALRTRGLVRMWGRASNWHAEPTERRLGWLARPDGDRPALRPAATPRPLPSAERSLVTAGVDGDGAAGGIARAAPPRPGSWCVIAAAGGSCFRMRRRAERQRAGLRRLRTPWRGTDASRAVGETADSCAQPRRAGRLSVLGDATPSRSSFWRSISALSSAPNSNATFVSQIHARSTMAPANAP